MTASATQPRTELQRLAALYRHESATTLKVLRAYPADQAELTPHPSGNSAMRLLHTFMIENALMERALRGEMGKSRDLPPPPASWNEGVSSFEAGVARVGQMLDAMSDEQFGGSVPWFTAPKTMGQIPTRDFLEFMIHDSIHHRGQLSIYLRMAGAKVPSIYGPSKDEPWN